jgi:hypothetical protein
MKSFFTRRNVLTLAGGSALGAIALAPRPAAAEQSKRLVGLAEVLDQRPLPGGFPERGPHIAEADGNGAAVLVSVPKVILTNQQLIPTVAAVVPAEMVGGHYIVRVIMFEDGGEVRTEVDTPATDILSPSFLVQVGRQDNFPVNDWGLSTERLFFVRASINVQNNTAFAVSRDFLFKVRQQA